MRWFVIPMLITLFLGGIAVYYWKTRVIDRPHYLPEETYPIGPMSVPR